MHKSSCCNCLFCHVLIIGEYTMFCTFVEVGVCVAYLPTPSPGCRTHHRGLSLLYNVLCFVCDVYRTLTNIYSAQADILLVEAVYIVWSLNQATMTRHIP